MKKIRKTSLILAVLLTLTALITSCGEEKVKNTSDVEIDLSSYPIETDISLTYYKPLRSGAAGFVENYSETYFAQEFEKRTGVKINYIHAPLGQESATLGLMISSNDLPDIIRNTWSTYQGGVDGAINDKIIVPLNDYKEYAPAYFKKLKDNPDWDRMAKSDGGNYSGFEYLQGAPKLRHTIGPAIRVDWLEELGLEIPETISEWETVLTAFKDKKGISAPFSTVKRGFLFPMFGAHYGLYVDGDEYKWGYAEPEMKTALLAINDWYKKGLLDKNIVTMDSKTIDAQILTGQTGATITSGGDIGRYVSAAQDPNFNLTGVRYPTYEKGDVSDSLCVTFPVQGHSAAITTQCKYPELAAKVLDYNYTEEGDLFANFGVEGTTYNMVDGEPIYTDLIVNNPDGLSTMEALSLYVKAGSSGAYECAEGYIEQFYGQPQQQAALSAWQIGFEESEKNRQRPLSLTMEESQEVSDITAELSKYSEQMANRFITGQESLDGFDAYVEHMKGLGLDRLCEIYTGALKRFNNR